VGDELAPFVRVTDFPEWNRYAAVNDEFIDVHMSADAARAAGQPDVFGMGNLRIAYAHNVLHDWLDGRGDVAEFGCQFRGLNFRGDELTTWGRVTAVEERGGLRCAEVELGVRNQAGDETMPATATVVLFDGEAQMPEAPAAPEVPSREVGVHLDAATIACLGVPTEPVSVGAAQVRLDLLGLRADPRDRAAQHVARDAEAAGPVATFLFLVDVDPAAIRFVERWGVLGPLHVLVS